MTTRPVSAILPRQFHFWPEDKINLRPDELEATYLAGSAGAWKDPVATQAFEDYINGQGFGSLDGAQAAREYDLAGSGEGRLIIPFVFVEKCFPGSLPGPAQERGDCVSHDTKNACLTTLCCDIVSAAPDEVTGQVEGVPDVPPAGIAQGVLSSEAIYWYRGYNSDGWSCDEAARVVCESSAMWLRKPYPELDVDFTKYSGALAGKYGAQKPPAGFTREGQKHLIRTSTRVSGTDIRDFLANGYGISSCGGEGWENVRDENGFSRRKGSWAHAMVYIGYDDRDIIKAKYGEALILILNSWAKWNTGPRKILGTDILIPEGAFWARASDCVNRQSLAFSGANGWPQKKLPAFDLVVG